MWVLPFAAEGDVTVDLRWIAQRSRPGSPSRLSYRRVEADQLALLNRQLRDFDRAVAETFSAHPDAPLLLSFPGIATVVGAAILARLGEDRARSPEPSVLPAKAGLAPVTRSSGRTRSVRFRYAVKEPPVARRLHAVGLHLDPALTLARSAYDALRARGQQHHRALRNAAARWVCVLWRCLQDQTPYEPARHLGAARAA